MGWRMPFLVWRVFHFSVIWVQPNKTPVIIGASEVISGRWKWCMFLCPYCTSPFCVPGLNWHMILIWYEIDMIQKLLFCWWSINPSSCLILLLLGNISLKNWISNYSFVMSYQLTDCIPSEVWARHGILHHSLNCCLILLYAFLHLSVWI